MEDRGTELINIIMNLHTNYNTITTDCKANKIHVIFRGENHSLSNSAMFKPRPTLIFAALMMLKETKSCFNTFPKSNNRTKRNKVTIGMLLAEAELYETYTSPLKQIFGGTTSAAPLLM